MNNSTSPLNTKILLTLLLFVGFAGYQLSAQAFLSINGQGTAAPSKEMRNAAAQNADISGDRLSVNSQFVEEGIPLIITYTLPRETHLKITLLDYMGNEVWSDYSFFHPGEIGYQVDLEHLEGYLPNRLISTETTSGHTEVIYLGGKI